MKTEIEIFSKENTQDKIVAGFDHYERVYKLAKKLLENQKYNDEVLHAAVFLHDLITEDPHEKHSARKAKEFLKAKNMSEDKLVAVEHCILNHTFFGKPNSKEAIALHDADILDFLGAAGIVRLSIWAHIRNGVKTLQEVLDVLKRVRKLAAENLISEKAKELAKPKVEFMDLMIKRLEDELK